LKDPVATRATRELSDFWESAVYGFFTEKPDARVALS
jgi:regulation of enolase protein 1 (concanavalin A-like superfamily)